MRSAAPRWLWLSGGAALWLGLWLGAIHQVTKDGATPAGPIVHDAANYLRMVEHGPTAAIAPFCFRVGQPAIARALPLPATLALPLTSAVALWLAVLVWWRRARALGFSTESLLFAAAATASTQGWAGLFANPFLSDAAGHLGNTLAWSAWLQGSIAAALLVALVGPLFREQAASWWVLFALRGNVGAALGLTLASAVVLFTARHWPGMPAPTEVLETARAVFATKGPTRIVGDAFAAFHGLWLVAVLGVLAMPVERRRAVLPPLLLSLGVGAALCLVAVNTVRMLSFALPFVALAWASFAEALLPTRRRALVMFAVVLAVGGLLWFPNRLWGASPKALQYVLGAVVALVGAGLWRRRAHVAAPAARSPSP